jgi:hypothetical protein
MTVQFQSVFVSHLQNDSGCFNFAEKSLTANIAKLKPQQSFPHSWYGGLEFSYEYDGKR